MSQDPPHLNRSVIPIFWSLMHPFPYHKGVPTLHCPPAQPPPPLPQSLPPRHSFSAALEFYCIEIARKIETYRERRTTNCFIQIRGGRTDRAPNEESPRTTCQDKMPTDFESVPRNSSFSWCLANFRVWVARACFGVAEYALVFAILLFL